MKTCFPASLLVCLFLFSSNCLSAEWSRTTVSFLYGTGYNAPSAPSNDLSYSTLTFDNLSLWKHGDSYFFTDIDKIDSANSSAYLEWTPRFSSRKLFNARYTGLIKDLLFALELNFASGNSRSHMAGMGIDLNTGFFDFLTVNAFLRDDRGVEGTTFQLKIVWDATIERFGRWRLSGFFEFNGSEGTGANRLESHILTQPQFLFIASESFEFGIEHSYWKNKFGIDGFTESAHQMIFKWIL